MQEKSQGIAKKLRGKNCVVEWFYYMNAFLLYASRVYNMQRDIVLEELHFAPSFLINAMNVHVLNDVAVWGWHLWSII